MLILVLLVPAVSRAEAPSAKELGALRAAIGDLSTTFGAQYPRGREFLEQLDALEKAPSREAFDKLHRAALLANPLLTRQPIVFVTRKQYARDHHNTATFFPAAEREYNDGRYQGGGALKHLDVASGKVTTLLDLPQGVIRDIEVSFDGKRILASIRKDAADSYHIYELNADGTGLKQLTRARDVDDLDPCYLPDGGIVFSSTREPKYCACNRHIMANLFRMEADGANIHQIGKSTLFEGHASLLGDGRILYDRWEYVDRNFGDAQGLWVANPDGSAHAIAWGNNTPSPGGVVDGREIPGTGQIVCTFTSCHDRPWGAIAIVDPRRGLDGREPVVRIWPESAINLVRDPGTANNAWDLFMQVKLKYEDPYPLSDKYILCARMTGKGEQTGLYLLDTFGNEVQIHVEEPGCFDPMPLAPRNAPPVAQERRDLAQADGYFYIQDVHIGTHMAGVKPGDIKAVRIVESPEKRFWTRPGWNGQGFEGPAMNWHDFGNKVILGTVPVEADGSAYFRVPAEKFVFFQLLDEKGRMVQSMRSGTIVQPGELQSCVGCHDDRHAAPPVGRGTPLALRRTASRLDGWRGETRAIDYRRDVQPIWDKHCVSCHDYGHEGKSKINLAGDRGLTFSRSYSQLWSRGQVKVAGAGPAQTLEARTWGSSASPLLKLLDAGHYEVKLSAEETRAIITWLDLNAPYYPSYATAYPDNRFGRSPLNDKQLGQLSKLTGDKLDRPDAISFDRPDRSPCLEKIRVAADTRHADAVQIIEAGRAALLKVPNSDDPAFVPCETDQWREVKYAERRAVELKKRQAILEGKRVGDE